MLKKILILIIIPFMLCSCTTKNEVEEISFSSWGSITEVKILNKIISDFEKENPQIKINFIHIPQNYFQKLHLLFASNQAPDVVFINNLYLPLYADFLHEASFNQDEFFPQAYEALSYNGNIYAIPRDISNLVFYYNKELVSIPKIWEFKTFVQTLEQSRGKYKISYERDIYWANPYILTLGTTSGINFYKNLEGKYAPSPSQVGSLTLGQMFINGDLAFYLSGRWMYPKIKESAKFSWDIIPFPGTTSADASGWAICKNTKHYQASQKFVNFLSSKQSIDYFSQTGLIIPARVNSMNKVEKKEPFLKAIQNSKPHIVEKNYKKHTDKINKELFH